MNKILVPVDFSDTSFNALKYATKLFAGTEVEITILNTYHASSSTFAMKSIDKYLEEDAQMEMDALLMKIEKDKEPGVSLKTKILHSSPITAITSLGNRGEFDLIIMGTKGASGLKEVFLGSVAGGVIAKTEAPVLVVPDNCAYRPLKEIVFAISGIPFSDPSVVDPLRKLANIHSSEVSVLHIAKEETPNLKEVVSIIDDLNPSLNYDFGTGDVNVRLNDYLKQEDAQLLCLLRSKKDFFTRLFEKSVTKKQTFSSPVPLLILHN
jgi:nucleotide-binding universal stress UspA family protein